MLTPELINSKWETALPYDQYVATGKPSDQDAWKKFEAGAALTDAQTSLLSGFTREVNALFVSGTWCGDCVQQLPLVRLIELANPGKIRCRYVDRDQNLDLAEPLKICGGLRVPVGVLLNEDMDVLALVGDRSISRYRAMAARQLGPSCPLPGAPVPPDEVAATLADWVEHFERAHLVCRLSTKLRQRYAD